uniref:VWFD domain-containing protein n=1 Tax=Gopherus evgoodei TaxID=1825980 RepID=A0A8C4YFY3_9SAUR
MAGLSCAQNSHYEVCARGCQSTCSSLYTPVQCSAQCWEGCVCDEGFVLSGDECVPISQCGCGYLGFYYKAGETFHPTCQEQCVCQASGDVLCKGLSCHPNEECKLMNGIRKCQPVGSATCSAAGDPHYLSFDGVAFDFQGTCTYILAKTCTNTGNLTSFAVKVENVPWGNGKVSVTKLVSVEVYGLTLTLLQNKKGLVMVNGVSHNLPVVVADGQLQAYQHGGNVLVQTDFGLTVSFDLVYHARVTIPGNYQGQTCGLCGNYNGRRDDEFLLPDGRAAPNVAAFGSAWKVLIPGVACEDGCTGDNCPVCEERKKNIFKQRNYCGLLTASDGPFAACHSTVSPTVYFNNCLYDLCLGNGDSQVLCQSIHSYVTACQEARVTIQPWRSASFCPLRCPANGHYELCADLCTTTCARITDARKCPDTCAEGCQCDDGFLFDGQGCVPLQSCGCFNMGLYYKPNNTVLRKKCQQSCTCIPAQGFTCEAHSCASDETCEIRDGVMQCINKDPCKVLKCRTKETCKIENGRATCVPSYTGTCWGWGDPHYHTFDGLNFDFQGTCTYTIAKYCGTDPTLVPFTINEKNDNRGGNQAVSYVRLTHIYVYGYNIAIYKNEVGKIRINDVTTSLPVTLEDGKIKLYQSGLNAILQTDFGLQVSYDWNWHLIITLPSSYYGAMCGLCGDFNQNSGDDMTSPNGTRVSSIVEWAKGWKVKDQDPFCWDVCKGKCPTCDESKKETYGGNEYCGLISKAPGGPFRECHPKVSPEDIFDSCIYDVCLNGGAKNILCQALEAYAAICKKQGITVYDWRTPSGCVLPCPENSHYEACGNACPASCSDRTAPSSCREPCVETCQCDNGYVLSAGQCVPVGSCGCDYNGRYYKPSEEFWADENCRSRCRCDPSLGMVVCQETSCKASERCAVINGVRDCHAISYSTCMASGDPHYTTFDGKKYDFMGTCIYQLAGVCSKDPTLTPFNIKVENNNRGSKAVSYTKTVTLEVYGRNITVSQQYPRKIKVDGVFTNLPFYHEEKLQAYVSGSHIVIKTAFGLRVTFDGSSLVRVTVPNTYASALCGLCGDNNQTASDDLTMRNGSRAANAVQFAQSWKVGEVPGCLPSCTTDCPVCSEAQRQPYKGDRYCGVITRGDGPFRECHEIINPAPFFDDCVFDACQYKGHRDALCSAISAYVTACQARGIQIGQWRSALFCSATCPRNSHYELCGSGCPATCHGLSAPNGCDTPCAEGCFCDSGFLLSGDRCVPIAQCGCVHQGRYYRKGEEFYTSTSCQERCRCQDNGVVECREASCRANEQCRVKNGILGCHAVGCSKCVASGDPHYLTFDGRAFDFQGTCTYSLARVCSSDAGLANFSVMVENESYGNGQVSVARLVVVSVHCYTITMERGRKWKVMVDGELYTLPLAMNDGKLQINQEGNNIIVQSASGLKVLYDTSYYVLVSIPSSYKGHVCGLCGNFNGDKNDDFLLPSGKSAQNADEFGASWKVPIDGATCTNGCGERCPVCDAAKTAPYKVDSSCGLIRATSGPFKYCHSLVSPTEYFNHCLYDMCAANGAREILCQSVQAYTAACQAAGATVSAWRTASFCPFTCPANSHYELCTRSCDFTCAGLFSPAQCTAKCFEGCQCDAGYAFNGETCTSMEGCGCVRDGRYIKVGAGIGISCHPASHVLVGVGLSQLPTGTLSCSTVQCRKKETCQIVDGRPECVAESESTCWAQGDPHYHTFDGRNFDFMGTCTYTIAKACGSDSTLPSFSVKAKNDNRGNTRVSYVGYVTVEVYNVTVSVVRYETGFVRVNDQRSRLPISVLEGKLRVCQSGGSVVIETDFSLRVSYNWGSSLVVKISSSFWESVCGLCGNYNGDARDDFATPAGTLAASPMEFGRSWKVEDGDRFCWDDCHGECKSCSPELVGRYKAEPFCGWITKEAGGLFSRCHSMIDPKIYLDNCVYDLCMNNGLKEMLCQALASYADACRRDGVSISDWRTPTGCSLPCPENSQYQLCGSVCPATCNDQAAPNNCSLPCVETCQCNEGFVLDAGKCIPKASCGCKFNGHLYALGEQFWGDRTCTRRCLCDPQTRQVSCQASGCRTGEQCRVENGIQNCYPSSYGTCSASGDPHYISFDGKKFDFQGTCLYQFAGLCIKSQDLVDFQVLVQNDHRGSQVVSFTKVNRSVFLCHSCLLSVRPFSLIPCTNNSKISIYRRGQEAVVQTDFGLTVAFDWQGRITVTAPSTYAGAVCGLCGNFNGDKGDELTTRGGTLAPNPTVFGQSWKVKEIPGCMEITKDECSDLEAVERHQRGMNGECGILLDKSGPFRECHSKVDPEGYFQDCVYDYCFFKGQQAVICQLITSYATACHAAGVTIYAWRTNSFCSLSCAQNSHYEVCARGCQLTCSSFYAPIQCSAQCWEGCVCDEGFVLSGDECVPISQCGCVYLGFYYKAGEIFHPTCQEQCVCQASGDVLCKGLSCRPNEECKLVNGIRKCQPVGSATCSAAGDPHYLSFDGVAFDFQGTCTYILAKSCTNTGNLTSFAVKVENKPWGNGKVSVTKLVSGMICLFQVDGVSHNLPLVVADGQLQAYQHGGNVLVQTDFGLTVSYDLLYHARVTVPGNYQGQTCGLCGNYNGRRDDEFLLPDGRAAPDVAAFGSAWKVPIPGAACEDGCAGNSCPVCKETKRDFFKQRKYCGLLTAPDGPFAACHSTVSPTVYFNNCLYDLCLGNGDSQVLCQSIYSYVTACQEARVTIQPWRSASFCPLRCPANGHYELCADLCTTTCARITDARKCPDTCAEGCQCDDGFLFDGQGCVPLQSCGCFNMGLYYKVPPPAGVLTPIRSLPPRPALIGHVGSDRTHLPISSQIYVGKITPQGTDYPISSWTALQTTFYFRKLEKLLGGKLF